MPAALRSGGLISVVMLLTVALLAQEVAAQERDEAQPPRTAVAETAEGEADKAEPTSRPAQGGDLASEESLARLQQLLTRRPLHAAAFTDLVRHYADQGKLRDLVGEYEQRVAAMPDDKAAQIVLARLYLRAGQAEKAAEAMDRVGSLPEQFAREGSKWLVFKSEVYQRTGKLEAAQEVIGEALKAAKTIAERLELSEALADLHLRADEKEKAAEALTALAAEFPGNYLHGKRIADALAQRGLNEQAVEQYRALLPLVEKQTDERCEVLRQLGGALERLEKRQDAIDAYTQAVNLLSSGHWLQQELHERIVSLYRASGRLDELVQYCRAQVERSPQQTALRGLLADVLGATGDTAAAKEVLAEAVQLFPKDRPLSQRRIQFLERITDGEGVAAEYERIIAQYPEELELYVAYGQFLAGNKQLEAARNQWKHVLQSELADPTLAERLGGLFETYELFDDAVECYERSITVGPKRSEGYAALSRLWFYRGEKDQALATLRRMADANPDDAETQSAFCQAASGLGLIDEALAAITRAGELAPDKVDYQMTRADLLIQAGRLEESLKVRRTAIDLIRNPLQQSQAIGVLVSMYGSANKLEELKKAEEERLANAAGDPVCLLLLARAADFERDFPAARRWLNALLDAVPAHEEAGRQLAKLLEATGDMDAAVEMYRKLIEQHPARAREYYQGIADVKLKYDDRAGVIDTFDKMVQASPGNATVLKEVGEQLVRLGELEKAVAAYEQSLRIQPDRPEVQLQYAKALVEAGRLEDALKAFKAAALQRTDRDTAAEALAKLHETAGKLGAIEEVLEELQARAEADPDNTMVVQTLAELLIQEYEYKRAMDLLDLVMRHNPRDAELQLVRAELLRRLTRFDEAIEVYRRVLRYPDIDRDFVLGELGKALFEAGRVDEARTAWRQVNNKLYAGTLMRNNGLANEAIEVLREGIRLKPDDYGLHRNLVRALEVAGKADEALDAARRLLDLEPDNILNIKELAKAYLQRGNRAAATEVAARLFSAAVAEKNPTGTAKAWSGTGGAPLWAMSLQSAWGGYGSGQMPQRSNLESAVAFFEENGLLTELEEVLTAQLAAQPDNTMLRLTAEPLFSDKFGKPEIALRLFRELETATFPLEYQQWLGQCSQQDWVRVREYQLIGTKPGLRDKRLAELESKPADESSRDEVIELAIIRQAQGATDKAIELLQKAVAADANDVVALSALVDLLVRGEKFADAEPHARALVELLVGQRERMQTEMVERVRRDFVRSLPVELQLRVTEDLLRDIALKWTLGQSIVTDFTGGVQTMGYFRARLTLATICAKTDRMEEARKIWAELVPSNPADADGWTMLAGVAQLHDQNDLAFEYYQKALGAARVLAGDPLLQRVYGGSLAQLWLGEGETIDSAFNKIVEAFAAKQKLIELYDFLRESEQTVKARRVAEQYNLYGDLEKLYRERVEQAREEFRKSPDDTLNRSVPYFLQVCKLAEICDRQGKWTEALKAYEEYLSDFPDELGLLITLGEVAEAQNEYGEALQWEEKVLQAKERLARRAREWALREIFMTPEIPQVLGTERADRWDWAQRWGKGGGSYGGWSGSRPFELWPSWLRIAQLHLAGDNVVAAGNALERAIGAAGGDRDEVAQQIISLIQQRQLAPKMLPVLRSLAVQLPTDERTQLAFAESLEANDKRAVAAEVYRRMLRRGVSNVGVLAQVRSQLERVLGGEKGGSEAAPLTLAALEGEVAADPNNANNRLRLARAYYYSLDIDKALEQLLALQEIAPHLEGLHDLLIEIYTIKGDSDRLIEALRMKVKRVSEDRARRAARRRLADELLTRGDVEEALTVLKELPDPKEPNSYERVGVILHYFGRHDEAIAQFELADRSQQHGGYGGYRSTGRGTSVARALAVKGDYTEAARRILDSIDDQARQSSQSGGVYAMYSMFESEANYFQAFLTLFLVNPDLMAEVERRLVERHESAPNDPLAMKLLMQFYNHTGRADQAEALVDKLTDKGVTEQTLAIGLIDRAIQRKEYPKAIDLAEKFIAQQSKPTLPPGVPPQFAGMMNLMSPRNIMLCKLGDIYWKMNDPEKAFAAYRQVLDEKVDETRLAFAGICLMRDRAEEARTLVEEALTRQQVKSPSLLQFRALLAAIDDRADQAFDYLAQSVEGGSEEMSNAFFDREGPGTEMLVEFARGTNQLDAYVKVCRKRLKKNPNKWQEHQQLAQTLYDAGRWKDAFKALDRAGKVKAISRDALAQRIEWMEGYASPDELIKQYETLIQLSERKVKQSSSRLQRYFGGSREEEPIETQPLRDRLGQLLWEKGERERAEQVWTERMDQKAIGTHLTMGHRFMEKAVYDRAKECFTRAIELQPTNMAANRALATLAFHDRDFEALVRYLREVFLERYRPEPPDSEDDSSSAYDYLNEYRNRRGMAEGEDADLRRWALELSQQPEIAERCRQGQAPEDGELRLMLTLLTGNWTAAEKELSGRLDSSPCDPMIWTLWALAQERKGEWAEAIKGWEQVRRLSLTTIADHRDQLKLVLAGKQIKDAAAGIKTAQPTPGGPPTGAGAVSRYSRSYYGGYDYDYSGGGSDVQHLAALYVKLGQYEKAEHLLLLGGGRDVQGGSMAALASLMWRQEAKERALELERLAVLQSSNAYQVTQFATMLAEAGQTQAAVDLLGRAYRCLETRSREGGLYAAMYGYYDDRQQGQGFETDEEASYASSLYDILQRAGNYDAVLSSLRDQAREQPADKRLAKLILSLLIRDRRWDQARDSLVEWRKARPHEPGVLLEQLHADLQLGDWEAALAVLNDLREEAPETMAPWRMNEAFVRLMQGDKAAAAAAVEPLLDAPQTENAGVSPPQIYTVLAVARDHDRLGRYLEKQRERGLLDENGRLLSLAVRQAESQWPDAVKNALDEIWRSADGLEVTNQAYRVFVSSVQAAKAAGTKVEGDASRPEDQALIILAAEGSAEGKKALAELVAGQPENINARRGLVFAAMLDHDWAAAVEANQQLISLLTPRRRDVWQAPKPAPLAERAKSFLAGFKTGGLNTQTVLGLSMNFGSMLGQMLNSGGSRENDQTVLYDNLWMRQQRLHGELLARSGRLDDFEQLLKEQAAQAEAQGRYNSYNRSYRGYRGGYPYASSGSYSYDDRWSDRNEGFNRDWRYARRLGFWHYRLFEPLVKDYESLGSRLPSNNWPFLSESYAALGRDADARQWLRKAAELQLAHLRAGDAPKIESQGSWYGWEWGWYGQSGSEDVERLRNELRSGLYRRDADPDQPDPLFFGTPTELCEFALIDPEIGSRLVELAAATGPGWGDSQTVRQLVSYYDAKHQPQEIIALLERTIEPDALLRSNHLGQYLQACYETKDEARVERVLEKAAKRALTLENDVLLARLVLQWDLGKDAEAEQLERQLVDRCRRERENPNRPDQRLAAALPTSGASWDYSYYRRMSSRYYNYYGGRWPGNYMSPGQMTMLADVPSLANALGIRCEASVSDRDMTLERMRSTYSSHGLYKHALRILDMELSRDQPPADARQGMQLLQRMAEWLARTNKQVQAKELVGKIEAFWRQEAKECPADATPYREIAELYASEKIGPDYAKAAEALQAAKRLDPACDASGAQEARYLYELGRFAEAWAMYQVALIPGEQGQDADILYRAGIAAAKAGQSGPAASLLRQALWRDPQHKLAAQAKELVP